MSVGTSGGGAQADGADPHFIQQQGGWQKTSGDPGFTYTQDFMYPVTRQISITNTYAVNTTETWDLDEISDYIPTATTFQNYKINYLEEIWIADQLTISGPTLTDISNATLYIAPSNRSFSVSGTADIGGIAGAIPGCLAKDLFFNNTTNSGATSIQPHDSLLKVKVDNPKYAVISHNSKKGGANNKSQLYSSAPLSLLNDDGQDTTV